MSVMSFTLVRYPSATIPPEIFMYKGKKVIDVHGHISTPPHFRAAAYNLIALRTPGEGKIEMPDNAVKAALDRHLRMLDERNVDVQLISPRPVAMMQFERPFLQEPWARMTNDVIASQCTLHPTRFVGVAQLPQTREMHMEPCVAELERSITQLGFVGALVNPDPGGDKTAPGMDDKAWFPLYKRAEELDATLVVHPSISLDKRIEKIPHSYQYNNLTEETLATLLLENSDVFGRYPKLRVVVCHCGGAPRRLLDKGDLIDANNPSRGKDNVVHPSGEVAGGQAASKASADEVQAPVKVDESLNNNLFFDTCSYDPWTLSTAIRQRGAQRMVFGTESPGSGSAVTNPFTGKPADDILATIDKFDFVNEKQKLDMVHFNAQKVFPLLAKKLSV
jgi:predicted TIM-barrel fold metal-dependent hydrolase